MKTFTSAASVFVRIITFSLVLSALSLTAEARQGTGQSVSPKSRAQVQALLNQADLASRQGQNEKALDYLQQALSLAQAAGDKAEEVAILSQIGGAYSLTGQPQKALDYLQQALPLVQGAGEATILIAIGGTYSDTGQPQKALTYYQRALPIMKAVGDKAGEATILITIGQVYSGTGQPQKALAY